jgi:hypothetical protein
LKLTWALRWPARSSGSQQGVPLMETVVLRREQTFAGVACAGAPPEKVIVSRPRDFLRSEMGLIGQRERGHLGPSRWQPRKKRQFNARRPIQSRSSIHSKLSAKPVVLNYPFHDKPPGIPRNRFSDAVDVGFLGCVASQHTRPEMPCFRLAKCGLKLGLPLVPRAARHEARRPGAREQLRAGPAPNPCGPVNRDARHHN